MPMAAKIDVKPGVVTAIAALSPEGYGSDVTRFGSARGATAAAAKSASKRKGKLAIHLLRGTRRFLQHLIFGCFSHELFQGV